MVGGKIRSSTLTTGTNTLKPPDVNAKKAVTSKAIEKRHQLEQAARQKEEATRAPKPVFQAGTSTSSRKAANYEEADIAESDEDMNQKESFKRRPRTKQRKDWGPMPKEVGVDYLRQWDSRHS